MGSIPKEHRISLQQKVRYFRHQYENAAAYRRRHHIASVMVRSFLQGIHYFDIDEYGSYMPIAKEEGEIRSTVPVILPYYRHILGFLLANELGVSATPLITDSRSQYEAQRAYAIMTHWLEETRFFDTYDRGSQFLLADGLMGLLTEMDPFRQNVFVRSIPGVQIFPIPYDVTDPSELNGVMIASVVTKQWLELQDEIYRQITGKEPSPSMSSEAKDMGSGMSVSLPFHYGSTGGRMEGAVALSVYINATPLSEHGEYYLVVNDHIHRFAVGEDAKKVLHKGKVPMDFTYYDKHPFSFLGTSPCEVLIPAQLSEDRNQTIVERNAYYGKPLTFFNSELVGQDKIQTSDNGLVPFVNRGLIGPGGRPVWHIPPDPLSPAALAALNLGNANADRAVGFRSGIPFGIQEGRTESGPATSLLSQNATTSLNPVMIRYGKALDRTMNRVLDFLPFVWPESKVVRYVGTNNLGREIQVRRDDLPCSDKVILRARPLLAGGRQAMLSVLMQLKQLPGPDGRPGTEVTRKEFRRSLQEMNYLPPGLDSADTPEARIQTRINLLINDGQSPAVPPSDPRNTRDRLIMEDHKLALDMYRPVILDETFLTYSPQVQNALMQQLQFHRDRLARRQAPNDFDDDVDELISFQQEQFLSAAEADLLTQEGEAPAIQQLLESLT